MKNPNDVVLVIRRGKAEELLKALSNQGTLVDYVNLLRELEALLDKALKPE